MEMWALPSPKDLRDYTYISIFLGIKCLFEHKTKIERAFINYAFIILFSCANFFFCLLAKVHRDQGGILFRSCIAKLSRVVLYACKGKISIFGKGFVILERKLGDS